MTAPANRTRHRLDRVALHAAAYTAALIGAGPLLWSTLTAFKLNRDLYDPAHNPLWFNAPATIDHFTYLWRRTAFPTFVWNTLWSGTLVVVATLLFAVPAGYALARLRRPWATRLGTVIFLGYLVPPTLLFLPLSRLVAHLGLQDSAWSLVLVYPTFTIPVAVWLLLGFFHAVPRDVEEQALVDGCSRLTAFGRIALPVAAPGLVAVVVLSFVLCAGEYLYALAFVSQSANKVVSTGVPTELVRGDLFYWQSLQGAVVFVAVPVALVFNRLLERFVAGFTAGAATIHR